MQVYNLTVPSDYSASERLDKYISSLPIGMNRSKLKSGVTGIFVNGKEAKLSQKIKADDTIEIKWQDNIPDDIDPENIPLDIIYEDENVTVINKKQGMVVHPACGNWNGTLVNALLYHWGKDSIHSINEQGISEAEALKRRRPGIVHRLDKDTSGLIITAKNRDTEEWLQTQFKNKNRMVKEYIVISTGHPPAKSGDIRTMIIRDPKDRQKYKAVIDSEEGKFARTIYHCIATYGNYSLLRVRIKTGRTHQIRVHLKYIGCPILGDVIYNKSDKLFPNATLMLHAKKLRIILPGQTKLSTFSSKVPERFIEIEKQLKKRFPK